MDSTLAEHNQHYAPGNIEGTVFAALTALNQKGDTLGIEALAPLDQFHTGGLQSTRNLAKLAAITASDRVLDVGGGIGGPARLLAQEFRCHVTVIDLTEAYCRIGKQMTAQVKLTDRVRFQQGNALDLPFEDGSVDVVWTQHSTMNIPDKKHLYSEFRRVLRPGGRLALNEVTAGSDEPLHLPTMWAHSESMNFLMSSDALRSTITEAGFQERVWNDATAWSITWFQERLRAPQNQVAAPHSLGLQLLLGADLGTMMRNLVLNLQEGRVRVVEGVFERL
jgi:SAM-dependent methyltransferase